MTKGVFAYTTNILKRYGNNVIDLLPRGHEYCTAKQAEEYTKPLSKFFGFGVESSLLIIKSGGSKINGISKNNNNVNSQKVASDILLKYQRHLMALFRYDIKIN